jgi:methyl-accepting chemotaxis protein
MQKTSSESLVALTGIVEVFGHVRDISVSIAAAVGQQSHTTREIARTLHETTAASNEVAGNIEVVSAASASASVSAAEATQLSHAFLGVAEELDRTVRRFAI